MNIVQRGFVSLVAFIAAVAYVEAVVIADAPVALAVEAAGVTLIVMLSLSVGIVWVVAGRRGVRYALSLLAGEEESI